MYYYNYSNRLLREKAGFKSVSNIIIPEKNRYSKSVAILTNILNYLTF